MRRVLVASCLVVASCGNDLPSAGTCVVPGAETIAPPVAEHVTLAQGSVGFDDLRYVPELDRVLAAPAGPGTVYLVDPATSQVTAIAGLPSSIGSADAGDGSVFVADRAADAVAIVDPVAGAVVATVPVGSNVDYVRFSTATHELWVTEPRSGRIEILAFTAPATLSPAGTIAILGGPEGLVFDAAGGRAYTNAGGFLDAIDVAGRQVVGHWPTGCDGSHGFPTVDPARGLVFAGCASSAGAAVLDARTGALRAGYEVGSGEAILAYAPALGHFYLRGDPGTAVAMLGVCDDGDLSLLATLETAEYGHAATADDAGDLWVADSGGGGLFHFRDPYPAAP